LEDWGGWGENWLHMKVLFDPNALEPMTKCSYLRKKGF
jgi:hypothetical protein